MNYAEAGPHKGKILNINDIFETKLVHLSLQIIHLPYSAFVITPLSICIFRTMLLDTACLFNLIKLFLI